jgi:hypothetical protein
MAALAVVFSNVDVIADASVTGQTSAVVAHAVAPGGATPTTAAESMMPSARLESLLTHKSHPFA